MSISKMGQYTCREAITAHDIGRCLALRDLCFSGDGVAQGAQRDTFDARCQHFMIEEGEAHQVVCCFRLMILRSGQDIHALYSSQFYDLGALMQHRAPILELGRFCIASQQPDPDILRLAWAHIARLAMAQGVGMLVGCSSFAGTDWRRYQAAFITLHCNHQAPKIFAPRVKSPDIIDFRTILPVSEHPQSTQQAQGRIRDQTDVLNGLKQMPSLLRTYLMMGGWVSDHAVIDHDLGTIHVFTAVDVARIPAQRLRSLIAIAGQTHEN